MRQRAIERSIRRAKAQEAAALTEEAKKAARRKIRARQQVLRDHLADHPGLKRLRYREQLGAGSVPTRDNRDDAATPIGPDIQPDLVGGGQLVRPSTRRDEPEPEPDERPAAGPDQPELEAPDPAPEPVEDLTGLGDAELEARMGELMGDGVDFDDPRMQAVMGEIDRRDAAAQAAAARRDEQAQQRQREREEREDAQHAAMAELVEQGVPWDEAAAEVLGRSIESIRREEFTAANRVGGDDRRSFQELAREQYRLEIERLFVVAETETRGFMLSSEGQRAGIDPMSLFSGPRSRVERYASEELKRWFDENGRTNFTEFVESIEQGRGPQAGRDFNR